MAGARQNTGQEAIVNLSKKLDEMATVVAQQAQEQTSILSSLSIMFDSSIAKELSKQTQILMNIDAKLDKANQAPAVAAADQAEYTKAFGSMAVSIVDLIKHATPEAGKNVKAFFDSTTEGLQKVKQEAPNEKAVQPTAAALGTIGSGVLEFAFFTMLATPLLILSIPGAMLFGLNIRLLMMAAGTAHSPEAAEGIAAVAALGFGVLEFGATMFLYALIGVLALPGAILFGLTVRMILWTAGVANSKETAEAITAVIGLGWGVLGFGALMTFYSLLAPTAMIGATLFGLTVRFLLMASGLANNENAVNAINAVIGLGWGVLGFGFLASLYLIFAIPAFLGAMAFGITVRLLLKVAGVASAKGRRAINAVTKLGWGVIWFGLAMTLYLVLAIPAFIGAMLFGLTVRLLLLVAGVASRKGRRAINAVTKLGWGIIVFGLALGLYLIIGIPALLGAVLFGVTVFLISIVLKFVSSRKAQRGIKNLMKLGLAIVLFGLIIYVWNKTIKLMDVLMLAGGLAIIMLAIMLIGQFSKPINKGSKSLMKAAPAVILMGIAMVVWMQAKATWEQIGMLAATIAAIGTIAGVLGMFDKFVKKGSAALLVASVAVMLLSTAMAIWMASKVKWEQIGMLSATLVAVGAIGAIAGAGPIPGFIAAGSIALGLASIAVMGVSVAMMLWMTAKVKMADVGVLGATIAMLGVEFGLIGIPIVAGFIALGAGAMVIASAALLPITLSLAIFKAIKWTPKDGDSLENALGSVANGFMGGKMPGGIIAGLKFAAQSAARAVLVGVSALAMVPAGVALILISSSLAIFKATKFNETDSKNLESAIGAVIRSFSLIGDTERKKKMGITATYTDIILGIAALANAGDTLANLAKGVQEWANLTVTEYEVVNAGTKDAKIVPKGKVKLQKSDFDNAAYGMALVIKSIAEPFAMVGRLESGLSPDGNKVAGAQLVSVFGSGRFVSKGIEALSGAGNVLSQLADSTQKWANLKVAEFEVVGAGTKDAKLVIKSYRQLSQQEIQDAISNQAMIVSSVGKAFADVGRAEAGEPSGSPFIDAVFGGKKYVSKGVSALEKSGNILSMLADTTQKWAQLSVAEYEVVNAGTKDAKLVIKSYKRLSQTDIMMAMINQSLIVRSVGQAFADVGKADYGEASGNRLIDAIFGGKNYVSRGVEALGKSGSILSMLADSVRNWANMKVAEFEVVGAGTKDAKLVIKDLRPITQGEITMAKYNMSSIAMAMASVFANIGSGLGVPGFEYVKPESTAKGVTALGGVGNVMSQLAQGVKNLANMKFAEYEVVGAGTKDAKLVIKSYEPMTAGQIKAAVQNAGYIAMSMASVFAKIGSGLGVPGFKYVDEKSLKKGIEFVQPAANALKAMADSIAAMVKLEFVENEVVNGKIVPKSVRKITPGDLISAGVNISTLSLFMAGMMAKIGQGNAKDENGREVREADVKRGIQFVTDMSSPLQRMADTISKLANMEVVENTVIGGKIVPGKVTKLDPAKIALAGANAYTFVGLFTNILIRAGKHIEKHKADIEKVLEILPDIFTVITNMTNPINKWGEVKDFEKGMKQLSGFHEWILEAFDPKSNPKVIQSDKYFASFANNAKVLADSASGVQTFAENAQKVAQAMKEVNINVNTMDLKKLTLTSEMFKAISLMSKNPEAIAKAVASSMNKSFEELIKALKELAKANSPAPAAATSSTTTTSTTNTTNKPAPAPAPAPSKGKESKTSAGVQKVWIVGRDV